MQWEDWESQSDLNMVRKENEKLQKKIKKMEKTLMSCDVDKITKAQNEVAFAEKKRDKILRDIEALQNVNSE